MLALTPIRRRLAQMPARVVVLRRNYAVQPPPDLDEGEQKIFSKLADKFTPTSLAVQDVSGGCGTFYAISISSETFKGLPIVKQHRLVNDTLKQEIQGIHGLQLKTSVP